MEELNEPMEVNHGPMKTIPGKNSILVMLARTNLIL